MNVPAMLVKSTMINLLLPLSTYYIQGTTPVSSFTVSSTTTDSTYTKVLLSLGCDSLLTSPLCQMQNNSITFTIKIQNNQFVSVTRNNPIIYLTLDGNLVTNNYPLSLTIYTPQFLSFINISRSSYLAYQNGVIVSIAIPNPNLTPNITYSLTLTSSTSIPLLSSISSLLQGNKSIIFDYQNSILKFNLTSASAPTTLNLAVSGTNSLLIPVGG